MKLFANAGGQPLSENRERTDSQQLHYEGDSMTPRSWLFVPGDKPEMMLKAFRSGADAVIVDLEDAVRPQNKGEARKLVAELANAPKPPTPEFWVRINPLQTQEALSDLAVAVRLKADGILVPKAESASVVVEVDHYLRALEAETNRAVGEVRVVPIISETPKSVFEAGSYAGGCIRLAALTWGAEDLSAAVGATTARDERGAFTSLYVLARSLCIAAAAAAGVPAIDTVYPDFQDLAGLRAFAQRGRRDGFQGMLAIHPRQVPIINEAFTPTEAEIAHAERVVAAFVASAGQGAIALDGKMLDAPHLKQAQRILASRERVKR
jgi:citrate lyase subunit beta / citryl-CoA lyase